MKTVLAVAVHPDDETLGCGGTLLNYASHGVSLHWLIMTSAHEPDFSAHQCAQQEAQIEKVQRSYPFTTLHWLRLPTTRLETLPLNDVIGVIRPVIEDIRPQEVFVPNRSDIHSDHRVTFQAMAAVLKPFYMRSYGVQRVLACEVLSETDAAPPLAEHAFIPNVFVDISKNLDRKLEIMHLFESEIHPEPMPRSPSAIRAQARYRGSTIGVMYAEAFMLLYELL